MSEASRTALSRLMVAQDARWILDSMLSVRDFPSGSGVLPFGFLGHAARITYEGSAALRSRAWGLPQLVALLPSEHADVISRARHATKLLDDTKTSFSQLLAAMTSFRDLHHAHFTGNAVWFARSFERDLGLFDIDGQPIAATMPVQFQVGLEPTIDIDDLGQVMHDVSESLGGALIVLSAATGEVWNPEPSVAYDTLGRVAQRDVDAKSYLSKRYDSGMPEAMKLLLLLVETQMHTASHVLPLTEVAGLESAFRARFINLYHALRTIADALATAPTSTDSGTESMRELLSSPNAKLILEDPGARRVRNRSMHYEIRDQNYIVDATRLMGGIVETEMPALSFDGLRSISIELSDELSRRFADWRV